jgi:hypothetical protein
MVYNSATVTRRTNSARGLSGPPTTGKMGGVGRPGVTETCVILACGECGVHWYADGEVAKCADARHRHQQFRVHRHRSRVAFPDGTSVCAVSFDARDPYGREPSPDYGLYLDERWQPPWPHDHVAWADFGVPEDPTAFVVALRSLRERARVGNAVEIGCLGGHGRTGTALACLAVLGGHPASDAVAWVRSAYCPDAVETHEQEAFVLEVAT